MVTGTAAYGILRAPPLSISSSSAAAAAAAYTRCQAISSDESSERGSQYAVIKTTLPIRGQGFVQWNGMSGTGTGLARRRVVSSRTGRDGTGLDRKGWSEWVSRQRRGHEVLYNG